MGIRRQDSRLRYFLFVPQIHSPPSTLLWALGSWLCRLHHCLPPASAWVWPMTGTSGEQRSKIRWKNSEVKVLVAQLWLMLCDPTDYSLPGSSVCGILQAITVEWVAISFSRGSSQSWHQTQVCHIAGRSFTVWATTEAVMLIVSQFQEELLLL